MTARLLKEHHFQQFGEFYCDTSMQGRELTLTLPRDCDGVSELILALPTPGSTRIDTLIHGIGLFLDNRMDGLDGKGDLEGVVRVLAALQGKSIRRMGDVTYVPLPLACLNRDEVLMACCSKSGDITLTLELKAGIRPEDLVGIRVLGTRWCLKESVQASLCLDMQTMVVYQNQHQTSRVGAGVTELRLELNHEVDVIAVWGYEPENLKRLQLHANDNLYIDRDRAMLDLEAAERLHVPSDAHVMFIGPLDSSHNSLHAARIDNLTLVVELDAKQEPVVMHVVARSTNLWRAGNGRVGMAFIT